MKNLFCRFLSNIGLVGLLLSGTAAFSLEMTFGGRLSDGQEDASGTVELEAKFFIEGNDNVVYQTSKTVEHRYGVYQLRLDDISASTWHTIFSNFDTPVYIEISDKTHGKSYERQRFNPVPYALKVPVDNDTIVFNSDGKLSVGSSVGTVRQITAGNGLTGGAITNSGTITVDVGTTGNKIVQLSDGKLPSVDGSNLSGVNAEKLQTRNVSVAVPVSGQVLKWSGSAWVPSSDLVGETGSGEANTASNVTSGSGVGLFKGKVSADLIFYSLSPGAGMTISLVGDDVVIASTITQYTDAMAKAAAVADSITDSVTTIAPSQNAVFDALATKQESVTTSTDLNLNSITTNAVSAITVNPGVSTGEIKLKELSVNGANYVGLKAPGSITSDLTFTLPGSAGTNGQFLKTDGSGNLSWTDQGSALVTSVNTLTGAVTLTTTNIPEGTNLFYSDARAKTATVGDVITDAVTDKAPSQNAVFDALANKSETSHNHTGVYEPAGLSTDVVTMTKILNGAVTSAKIAFGVDAAKLGGGTIDNTEFGYLDGVTSAIQTQLDGKVVGPASATDNAIARFDGTTGEIVQNTSNVVIDDSGNVGIGTINPISKLDVQGASPTMFTALTLRNTDATAGAESVLAMPTNGGGPGLRLHQSTNATGPTWASGFYDSFIQTGHGNSKLHFAGGNVLSPQVTIAANGNVGIGTINPTQRFQVGTSGDGSVALANAWNTFSDIRLKRDLVKLPEALNKLEELNGYYYFWKDGEDQNRQVGVIAQEVEQVLPELVKTGQDGIKTVDYPKLTVLLIEAAKQLKADAEKKDKDILRLRDDRDRDIARLDAENSKLKADVEKFKVDSDAMKSVLCKIKPDAAFCVR